jgi:hypothetical protein
MSGKVNNIALIAQTPSYVTAGFQPAPVTPSPGSGMSVSVVSGFMFCPTVNYKDLLPKVPSSNSERNLDR